MPSSTYKVSVRSHVPVAVLLTSPLSESTAYNGDLLPSSFQICLRVTQPPRVVRSADSRYSRADVEEYRMDTGVVESHLGLAIALFGEGVSTASVRLAARRLTIAAVRSVVMMFVCNNFFVFTH